MPKAAAPMFHNSNSSRRQATPTGTMTTVTGQQAMGSSLRGAGVTVIPTGNHNSAEQVKTTPGYRNIPLVRGSGRISRQSRNPPGPVRTTNTMRVVTRSRTRTGASPSSGNHGGRVVLMASRNTATVRRPGSGTVNVRRSSTIENDPVVVTINRSPLLDTATQVALFHRSQRQKSRSVTFYIPEDERKVDSSSLVFYNDKFLVRIFRNLNWNELLPLRETCKKWLEVVSCDPNLKPNLPVVTIRNNVLEAMHVYNKSPIIWTQFRLLSSFIYDVSNPIQQEFWSKHGPSMTYLQIRNSKMSLTGFIDVLLGCVNLEHLQIMWTSEMYSFNSELIKKYFGIHFRNGTFAKMKELLIEKSSYMVDNALWSLLKWCGGPLRSLTLTCIPDGIVQLSRLKPRWSIEPIQNYANRFGYTGQLRFMDFSNSNLSSEDLIALGDTSALSNLTGIRLNSCRVSVVALIQFINAKGGILEELYLDNVPSATEKIFSDVSLPLLRCLSISGPESFYDNINFLSKLNRLQEFFCSDTTWCDNTILITPLEQHVFRQRIKKLEIAGNTLMVGEIRRANLIGHSKWFQRFLAALPNLVHLNASGWGSFGTDESFKLICEHLKQLEFLRVGDWKELADSGVTGIPDEELEKEVNYNNLDMKYEVKGMHRLPDRPFVGSLKHLHTLDISNSKVTNCSIKYGISYLKHLRKLALDETYITEAGLHNLLCDCKTLDRISIDGCDEVHSCGRLQRPDGRFVFIGKF